MSIELKVQKNRKEFSLWSSFRLNFNTIRTNYNLKCTKFSSRFCFLQQFPSRFIFLLNQFICWFIFWYKPNVFIVYVVPLLLKSLKSLNKVYITHFILLIHYSLFRYGDQVWFLLGWGVMNRLTLTCVTLIWSHKKMSGNPHHLYCRKLFLSEKDMLHQTMLEITNNYNPSKTTTKINTAKPFPDLQQNSYPGSDLWFIQSTFRSFSLYSWKSLN